MNSTENVLSTKSTTDLDEPSNAKSLIDMLAIFTRDQNQGLT